MSTLTSKFISKKTENAIISNSALLTIIVSKICISDKVHEGLNSLFAQITSSNLNSSINILGLIPVWLLLNINFFNKSKDNIALYQNGSKNLIQTIGNISYDVLEYLTVINSAKLVGAVASLAVGTIPISGIILPAVATMIAGNIAYSASEYVEPNVKKIAEYCTNKASEFIKPVVGKFTKKAIELCQAGAIIASGGISF